MARSRDYAAEYAARQARARASGYTSYWHQRQTKATARRLPTGAERESFTRYAKRHPGAEWRRLWVDGDRALRRKDHAEAERIARKLGYRPRRDPDTGRRRPARAVWWYHT
jgi:hypothetical protein